MMEIRSSLPNCYNSTNKSCILLKTVGCISIDGTFMCWARGTESALEDNPFANEFGTAVDATYQHDEWSSKMGAWESA
jgi:hypothetical protein